MKLKLLRIAAGLVLLCTGVDMLLNQQMNPRKESNSSEATKLGSREIRKSKPSNRKTESMMAGGRVFF